MNNRVLSTNIVVTGLSNINEDQSYHYLIYKITNLSTGQYYIGQHQTSNPLDDYFGSGKYLQSAQKKYGISCFSKYLMYDFNNFKDMDDMEKQLVQLSNCYPYDKMSYNLKEGGSNGQLSEETRKKISTTCLERGMSKGKDNPMYGKNWKDGKSEYEILEHNRKISKALIGNTSFKDARENDPKKYKEWCRHISENLKGLMVGENHPMYGKNPLANISDKAFAERSRKISAGNKLAHAKKTQADYDKRIKKTRQTYANKTEQELQLEHDHRSKAITGQKNGMFGNSLRNILTEEEQEQWTRKLSENSAMRGHSCADFMSDEAAKVWRNKVSNIWRNMPKEQQDIVREKRRKAMSGRKWYHNIENTVEVLFKKDDDIPVGFIRGRILKQIKNRRAAMEEKQA